MMRFKLVLPVVFAIVMIASPQTSMAQMSPEEAMARLRAAEADKPKLNVTDEGWAELTEAGTPYVVVPVDTVIAWPLSLRVWHVLETAKEAGIEHIVFEIRSPGGLVDEAQQIAAYMKEHDEDYTYHAFIHSSISAAIWIAFSCDDIFMSEGGTIGGALTYSMGSAGDARVDEKINSIFAAEVAALADTKGYASALVRGMMEPQAGVYLETIDEQPRFSTSQPGGTHEVVKRPNDPVITLTRDQAVRFALIDDRAATLAEIGTTLGHERWVEVAVFDPAFDDQALAYEFIASLQSFVLQLRPRHDARMDPKLARAQETRWRTLHDRAGKMRESIQQLLVNDPRFAPRYWDAQTEQYLVPSVEAWQEKVRDARVGATRLMSDARFARDKLEDMGAVQGWRGGNEQAWRFRVGVEDWSRGHIDAIRRIEARGYPPPGSD